MKNNLLYKALKMCYRDYMSYSCDTSLEQYGNQQCRYIGCRKSQEVRIGTVKIRWTAEQCSRSSRDRAPAF